VAVPTNRRADPCRRSTRSGGGSDHGQQGRECVPPLCCTLAVPIRPWGPPGRLRGPPGRWSGPGSDGAAPRQRSVRTPAVQAGQSRRWHPASRDGVAGIPRTHQPRMTLWPPGTCVRDRRNVAGYRLAEARRPARLARLGGPSILRPVRSRGHVVDSVARRPRARFTRTRRRASNGPAGHHRPVPAVLPRHIPPGLKRECGPGSQVTRESSLDPLPLRLTGRFFGHSGNVRRMCGRSERSESPVPTSRRVCVSLPVESPDVHAGGG